jgi:hypothetical protein
VEVVLLRRITRHQVMLGRTKFCSDVVVAVSYGRGRISNEYEYLICMNYKRGKSFEGISKERTGRDR